MSIAPTIGRQVWFRGIPWVTDANAGKTPIRLDAYQPMAATIVYVHNDRYVNLDVIDHAGVHWPLHGVTLAQPGDDLHPGLSHAEWTPYQLGQAYLVTPSPVQLERPPHFIAYGASVANLSIPVPAGGILPGTGQLSGRPH